MFKEDTTLPLISTIIPTYRRPEMLERAIESVLNQTYPNIELIVVDDNNSDDIYRQQTKNIMKKYSTDKRVIYLQHSHNKNGAAARNTGLRHSHGMYVCYLDDDDWYLPQKLERQYSFLQQHHEFQAVYCGYSRADLQHTPYKSGNLSYELLSGTDIIYTNTIMMEREKAIQCGGWDERFKRNQEAVFLLRFFRSGGTIGALSDILVQFDISDTTNRSNPVQFEKDFCFFLEAHDADIENCCKYFPDARQRIYSYRFRGVLLNYIKHFYFKRALRLYIKMDKLLPRRFRKDCFTYVKRRLLKQPIFSYEDERNINEL